MNDLQALTDNIISKAKEEAAAIVAQAKLQQDEILAEAARIADQKAGQVTADFRQKAETEERRLKIEAELEAKKRLLEAKQRLIDRVFQDSLTALNNLAPEQRTNLLIKRLGEAGSQGGGEVLGAGPSNEWATIVAAANEKIARAGAVGQLVLGKEQPPFKGGFFLKGENFTVNGSYQAILDELRETMIPEIAEFLFGKKG